MLAGLFLARMGRVSMSLGLVAFAGGQIHLAVESMGVPECGLESKLRVLQQDPRMLIVFTGYLDFWVYALGQYQPCGSLQEAAEQLKSHLEACPAPGEGAYGRVCGYEDGSPVLYRVDWGRKSGGNIKRVAMVEGMVEIIGMCTHGNPARELAQMLINRGVSAEKALIEAIESEIPRANEAHLRGPVHSAVI